jgi:hypothetical protein
MKKILIMGFLIALIACESKKNERIALSQTALSNEELIKRGKYLVTIGACHDCHSPKAANGMDIDTTRLLSGHPKDEKLPPIVQSNDWVMFGMGLTSFVGPWGVSYSANLTPHETGTGNWTFEQFKTAIRKGKYKGLDGTRDLLPPMPWQMYRNMTDDDLSAVFAYLQSLPPIDNLVPQPIPPHELQVQLTSNK